MRQIRIATIPLPAIRTDRMHLAWQIQDPDGRPVGVGLFRSPEHAANFAIVRGWKPGGFPGGK